jgi:branched-chain amino acid transport system ATP-binding protein
MADPHVKRAYLGIEDDEEEVANTVEEREAS